MPTPLLAVFKALASEPRLVILEYLKDPVLHFPPQVYGDLVEDGVCADFIREKLGISAATATQHLKVLTDAGLIRPKRIKQWTFFKRVEPTIAALKQQIDLEI
jgi:DNA-binding transcriptional ArsR family regulator